MEPPEEMETQEPEIDRAESFVRFREVVAQMQAATEDLSNEERDALVREITDAMDEGLRRRVLALRAAEGE